MNINPSQDRDPDKQFKLVNLKLRKRSLWFWAGWTTVGAGVAFSALVLYCIHLFTGLESLMGQAPKVQPSVIYSDIHVLRKGDVFDNAFLTERLDLLQIPAQREGDAIQWKARKFTAPETVLPSDSPLRVEPGQLISVTAKEGRIDSIRASGADGEQELEAIALEPTPVAQLSGAHRSIRNYMKLPEIPTQLRLAFIAIEDHRFLDHAGFDPRGLARAMWVNFTSGSFSQGASTITQQLIKNLLDSRQKTVLRKLRELVLAVLIEAKYSKDIILEKYLNEVYVGQIGALEVHGVAEAARYFYNKPLDKLSLGEMALIAGIVRGPAYYSPYRHLDRALERKDTVLAKMEELKLITEEEYRQARAEKLNFAPPSLAGNKAPYFVDFVKAQVLDQLREGLSAEDLSGAGLRVYTTIDPVLQKRADQAVFNTIKELEARYKIERPLRLEGILVAAEHKSGFIRALVGGRSYAETTFNRVLNMKRQVGSTFKPIAYLAAFLKGADNEGIPYTGAYMIEDAPWTYNWDKDKTWSPRNYEGKHYGRISLRHAFANSINVPMAKIGVDVGIDRVIEVAQKLGVDERMIPVPSLSLGSIDIAPLELLQAYATLANRGERVELTAVRAIVDENGKSIAKFVPRTEQVFEPRTVDIVNDMLKTVVREGTARSMTAWGYNKTARGKTGTTSFSRDAWFAGFSQGLAAVTWTGFDELKLPVTLQGEDGEVTEGAPLDEAVASNFQAPAPLTGAGSALPTWARFFAAAKPSSLEDPDPALDPELEVVRIDQSTGLKAKDSCPPELVREELFVPDTAPNDDCSAH